MHRSVACCVVAILLVASVPTGAATPDDAIGLPQEFDPDDVSLTASLDESGDATWTFTYRMRLETENETEAFQALQADVENNSSVYTGRFHDRIVGTVNAAENATDRNMSASNVSISTRVNALNEEDIGVVTYTFEWSNFAAVDGERVVAGDALEGFYLDNETSLRVTWPEQFALADVDPEANRPNENAVEWSGEKEFSSGQPRIVVAPSEDVSGSGDGGVNDNQEDDPTTPGSGMSGLLVPAVAGAVAAVLVVGAAGWYYREQRGGEPPVATNGDAADGVGGAAAGAAADTEEAEPPDELLSNEERVEKFLREQGGRAKQQDVVDAMDWTEAKTSQVVKDMRENDDVESFRIGRENVLKLPDEDGGEDET